MAVFSVSVQHAEEARIPAAGGSGGGSSGIGIATAAEVFDDEEVVLVGPVGVARLEALDGGDGGREVLLAAREAVARRGGHLLHRVALRTAAARQHRRDALVGRPGSRSRPPYTRTTRQDL